jgi:hypothetical protein
LYGLLQNNIRGKAKQLLSLQVQNLITHMKKQVLFALLFLATVIGSFGQDAPLKPQVDKPVYFDVSPPLRDMIQKEPGKSDRSWKDGVVPNKFPPRENNMYGGQQPADQAVQQFFGPLQTDTTIRNFNGIVSTGSVPPDTYGEASPSCYFQVVNTSYAIYNKSGIKIFGPVANSAIFAGMPNNTNSGDAVVCWDEVANRWLFSQFSLPNYPSGPFYQMIAISQTPDPTGSWYRYQYSFSQMPDYPKFGVWVDGYYMSSNNFGTSGWSSGGAYGYDRTAMLTGDPNAQRISFTVSKSIIGYSTFLPSDCDGTLPPVGTPSYFTLIRTAGQYLRIYEFHADFTNPANSTFGNYIDLPVSAFNTLQNGITQKGTTVKLETLGDRLMYRAQYRVFNGYSAIVLNHSVDAGSNRAGVRWYELRKSTGAWSIYQQSTYAPSDNNSRWMASIAMDTAGTIALGYSISGSNLYPGIRYTGRFKNDPLGQMTITEKGIINGGGCQTGTWDGRSRWGDYSGMCVDPACPTTFWYTQEYYASTSEGSWSTRVGSFTFGNVFSTSVSATPSSICQGSSSQLDLIAYGGSGNYTYNWSSIPAGFTSNISNPVVTPDDTTMYIAATSDGTITRYDTAIVKVVIPPTAFAGNDTLVCNWINTIPVQGIATNFKMVGWGSSGDGVFGDPLAANTTYTFGTQDKASGSVDLTFVAFAKPPCSGKATDIRHVVLDPCTSVPVTSQDVLRLEISPNPADGIVSISVKGLKEQASLSLTGMDGISFASLPLEPTGSVVVKQIDVTGYSKGVYIVRLKTAGQVLTQKLVIR